MKLLNCKYTSASGGCDLLGHPEMNILECLWNCGFYSNQFQVFSSLLILMRHGIIPDKISYSMGFKHYKKDPNKEIYHDFHKIDLNQNIDLYKEIYLPNANKKQFDLYDFKTYNQIVKRFFNPSDIILERKKILINKYAIDLSKTISVLYRGTDKGSELTLASPTDYLKVVQELLEKNPDFKVLIQTDQTQVIEFFYNILGDKIITFSETPSTTSNRVIWSLMEENENDSIDWSQWFDSALRCVSECKYVINHTGNVAFFANLYRGNVERVYQFNEFGELK